MREIPLTKGKVALVDDADYVWLMQWKWHYHSSGYATRYVRDGGKKHPILLHRIIMGCPVGFEVDHENRNKLDCQRHNLRIATRNQNQNNRPKQNIAATSQYKGVYWSKAAQRWYAQIRPGGTKIIIGSFASEIEAARAYDVKAKEHFGTFAYLNFPE